MEAGPDLIPLEAPPSSPGATAHLHLKQHTQNQRVLAHTPKVKMICQVY